MADNDKKKQQSSEDAREIAPHVNKAFAISVISIFMSILILPTLVWGVLQLAFPSVVESLSYNTGENREMASFPKEFNPDTITSDIENWYNDNLPFRSALYVTQLDLRNAIEKPYDKVIFPALLELFHASGEDETGNNVLDGSGGELITEATESETKPSFMEEDTDTETLPIFIEEDTDTETLPVFIEDDTDTETLPVFIEDDTDTETLPVFIEDDTESDTLPVFEDEYDNEDQKNCDHSYLDSTVTKEPTCNEFGIAESVCELCEHVKKVYLSKTEHDYRLETVAPTCTEFGYDLSTCRVCGDEKRSNAVAKAPHDYRVETVAPTCKEFGYDLNTCKVCGYEKKSNAVAKAPHDYNVETIAPTCTEFGYDLSTCRVCGYEKQSNAVQKTDHDYNVETIAPTCTEFGYDLSTCRVCGYERQSNAVAKLGHDWQIESEIIATCKREGEQIYKCINCLEYAPETVKIPKGHNGPATATVVAATKYEYGYTLNRCDTCGTLYRTNVTNKLADNSYFPLKLTANDKVVYGRGDWLFYGIDGSLSYYQATNILTESKMAEYTDILKELQALCDERGIELRIMIMPNKEQMYSEFMPIIEVKDSYKRVDRLVDYITENSSVKVIHPKKELTDAKPYYRVYWKYDTHWNAAGSFIGTQTLYKSLGMEYTSLSCVPYSTAVYTGGDLLSIGEVDRSQFVDDVRYDITYKPEITVKSVGYGGQGSAKSTSSSTNDKHYVMLGDSFRVSMIPFLQKDFAQTTIYHRNEFDVVKNEVLDADILVIAAVERYDADIFNTAKKIIELYKSNPVD